MDNISVVYATKTQHSKKLAEAIGKEFDVEAKNITKHPHPKAAGLLFLVGGIYAGKSNPVLLSYAEKLDASITGKVVLVTSSASVTHRNQRNLRALLVGKGIDVVDEITCPGGLLFIKFSHPNKIDIQSVAEAAKNISRKVATSAAGHDV
ncbi:MAG: flavodoxin [Firmicutes bacterium ADurb.Bin182]|nr:MAG: flavodoxin [Firmicutes bacterium ADurb.Bin182]